MLAPDARQSYGAHGESILLDNRYTDLEIMEGSITHDIDTTLRNVLGECLGLNPDFIDTIDNDTGLFGDLPELDSMAVATLLTEIEDRFDIIIDDDDIDGDTLSTYGALLEFTARKIGEK